MLIPTKQLQILPSIAILSSLLLAQAANAAANLTFPENQSTDSSILGTSGSQTNTLSSPVAGCTTEPTAYFDSTITTIDASDDSNDTASLTQFDANVLNFRIVSKTDAPGGEDTIDGTQLGWTTDFTFDQFTEALNVRLMGNTETMPPSNSDYVDWYIDWTGGDATYDPRPGIGALREFQCGTGTTTELVAGTYPAGTPVCMRFDTDGTQGNLDGLAGVAAFNFDIADATSITVTAVINTEVMRNGSTTPINAEGFGMRFNDIGDGTSCTSTSQDDAAAVTAAQNAQAAAEAALAAAENALAEALATSDPNEARALADYAATQAAEALAQAQAAAAESASPIAQAALTAAIAAAESAAENTALIAQDVEARARLLAAKNIPVFGPLGLLAMLSGLLWFGRRRKYS